MNQSKKPNFDIVQIKKLIHTLTELNRIDRCCEKKFNNNVRDISFYYDLLETSNNNFYTIMRNNENLK